MTLACPYGDPWVETLPDGGGWQNIGFYSSYFLVQCSFSNSGTIKYHFQDHRRHTPALKIRFDTKSPVGVYTQMHDG